MTASGANQNLNEASENLDQLQALQLAASVAGVKLQDITLPTDHHVTANGIRLHYIDWGATSDHTIVFLHGSGLNAHTFDLICLGLRPDYHCISVDLRGHGDSEWSVERDYSLEAHAADLAALVHLIGVDRFVLVGMSMGAMNSLEFVRTRAASLMALVLIDSGPEIEIPGADKIARFVQQPAELDSIEDFVGRALEFNPRRDPRLLRNSLTYNLRQLPTGRWTWKYDRRPRPANAPSLETMFERLRELWSAVDLITCPTLVVRGAESDVFTREQAAGLAARLHDGRWVEVEGAGHTVQGDNAAGLLAVIRSFLADAIRTA
jgi:pimeloyl-ACP methyl ester carboxylesterase